MPAINLQHVVDGSERPANRSMGRPLTLKNTKMFREPQIPGQVYNQFNKQ